MFQSHSVQNASVRVVGWSQYLMNSKLSPLLPEVQTHISSVPQVLEPFRPSAGSFLVEGVLNDGEVISDRRLLGEEGETHNVGHGSEGTANLELLGGQILLDIEVLDAVEDSVNGGFLLPGGDSHLLIAVGVFINLYHLSDEGAARISRVNTRIEGVVSIVIVLPHTVVAHAWDIPASSCCRVEHFVLYYNY
jgi:hypothetical protein